MFARNEQQTLPHRRHHHLITEEAPSSLYFTLIPRTLPCTLKLYPAPATLHLASSHNLPTRTLWLRYVHVHVQSQSPLALLRNPSHPYPPHADCLQQAPNQPRPYSGNYLPNGGAATGPVPGAVPLLPNQGRVIQQGSVRVLCIADVRGRRDTSHTVLGLRTDAIQNLQSLNQLAADARANYIIHTGDFGFYDDRSLDRIADKYVHIE